jgi:hypothetical protein
VEKQLSQPTPTRVLPPHQEQKRGVTLLLLERGSDPARVGRADDRRSPMEESAHLE